MSVFGPTSHGTRSAFRVLAAALGAALLGAGALPLTASAAPSIVFGASLTDCVVYGAGPALKTIKVTWKDADGTLKHVQTVKSDSKGRFHTTCDRWEQVERGDVFSAKIGTNPARTFTVPGLGLRIDRADDIVSGKGPASTDLSISLHGIGNPITTTTAPDGTYSVDTTSTVDIVGSSVVTVWFTTPNGDYVERAMQTPYLAVYRGRATVFMQGRPGSTVDVQLYDGPTKLANVDCTLDQTGTCWLQFTDGDGHPVKVRVGDRIVSTDIAADADFIIPAITVSANAGTDVVAGTCDPAGSSLYYVTAWRPVGSAEITRTGMTNGSGKYSVDLTARYDLRAGDKVLQQCATDAGDWIERQITVP